MIFQPGTVSEPLEFAASLLADLLIGTSLVVIGLRVIASARRKLKDVKLALPETSQSLRKDAAVAAR
jgi:hypothetical protein